VVNVLPARKKKKPAKKGKKMGLPLGEGKGSRRKGKGRSTTLSREEGGEGKRGGKKRKINPSSRKKKGRL